jgi:hypothetical protein
VIDKPEFGRSPSEEDGFWRTVEVFRKAHELSAARGWNAHHYAAKRAAKALADGNVDEHDFWKDVESSLTPRQNSRLTREGCPFDL